MSERQLPDFPPLEVECDTCKGEGKIGFLDKCYTCDGIGKQPTAFGKAVLTFIAERMSLRDARE